MTSSPPEPRSRRRRASDSGAEGLDVHLHGRRVGALTTNAQGLQFHYAEEIVAEPTPSLWAISVRLPVRQRPYDHLPTRAFFDNLLPEGETLELIARAGRLEPNNTSGLLAILGGECAGAVSLWALGHPPPPVARYRPFKVADLTEYFDEKHAALTVDVNVRGRMTLSGDQPKLVFMPSPDPNCQLSQDGAPSAALLKGGRSRYPDLVLNEYASLALMEAAGVPTVRATVRTFGVPVLDIPRYDRTRTGDGRIRRLHQEDFCQATGRQSMEKYSDHSGVTVEEIAFVIRKQSAAATDDLALFARWVFANLCIGNQEGHAKNLSLLSTVTGRRLAPAYDVVCTEVYPTAPRTLPLFIGPARTAESVTRPAIVAFSRTVGLDEKAVIQIATDVTERLGERARDVLDTAATAVGGSETLAAIAAIVAKRVSGLRSVLTAS